MLLYESQLHLLPIEFSITYIPYYFLESDLFWEYFKNLTFLSVHCDFWNLLDVLILMDCLRTVLINWPMIEENSNSKRYWTKSLFENMFLL